MNKFIDLLNSPNAQLKPITEKQRKTIEIIKDRAFSLAWIGSDKEKMFYDTLEKEYHALSTQMDATIFIKKHRYILDVENK